MTKTKIIIIAIIIIMLAAGFFAFLPDGSRRKLLMKLLLPVLVDFPIREKAPAARLPEVPVLAEQPLDLLAKQIKPTLSPN